MENFTTLKSTRAQREAARSVTQLNHKASENAGRGSDPNESVSVDSLDASKIFLDQPQQSQSDVVTGNRPLYSCLPSGLRVGFAENKGRGVWSCNPRRKGQLVLSETQTIAVLSTRYLPTHCSACFLESPNRPLKRCPTCRLIYYCDSECQTRDWSLHKHECPALQKWAATAPRGSSGAGESEDPGTIVSSDAIRALGRILWRRQKNKGRQSVWVNEMDAMQSHRPSLSVNEHTSELHTHMVHALVRYVGAESINDLTVYGIGSITNLVDLVSRFTTNAFAVTSPSLTPIGVCISPTVALFNHSCEPNAVLVFSRAQNRSRKDEPMMGVVAIRDIAADEQIAISYIDPTLPRHDRQQALKETYHFTCDCSLCSKPREGGTLVDPRQGMHCPRKCGGACCLPTEEIPLTRCTKCGAVVKDTDAVLDAVRIGQEGLNKATRVQLSDPSKAIQLTTNLMPILSSAGLLPSSHPLLALSRLHTTLLITSYRSPFDSETTIELNSPQIQEQRQIDPESKISLDEAQEHLDEAVRSATRTCNALNQLLPYGHPIRGLAVAELGKLLSVDEPQPKHLIEDNSHPSSPSPSGIPQAPSSVPSSTPPPQLVKTVQYPPSGPQRLKLAYETLIRARAELIIGFGDGGMVGMEVRELLVDVEKELGVWKEGIRSAVADLPKTSGSEVK